MIARALRRILLAVLLSALLGIAIGTWIRLQMEQQTRVVYIG